MNPVIFDGDLLDFPKGLRAIAHSCNCQNTMGGGIAKAIRDRYPQAWEADCEAARRGINKLGQFSDADIGNKRVYNLYTQKTYGRGKRFVNYEAFYEALCNLRADLEEFQDVINESIPIGFHTRSHVTLLEVRGR